MCYNTQEDIFHPLAKKSAQAIPLNFKMKEAAEK